MLNEQEAKFFAKHGLTPPEHIKHDLTPDDIAKKLEPANPRNWRQEGNHLICMTDFGELTNRIPTNKLLVGEKDNLPIFKDI